MAGRRAVRRTLGWLLFVKAEEKPLPDSRCKRTGKPFCSFLAVLLTKQKRLEMLWVKEQTCVSFFHIHILFFYIQKNIPSDSTKNPGLINRSPQT